MRFTARKVIISPRNKCVVLLFFGFELWSALGASLFLMQIITYTFVLSKTLLFDRVRFFDIHNDVRNLDDFNLI